MPLGTASPAASRPVWRGECESDSLNRLVVTAGIDWRQVQILRAYRKYHHRVNASFPVEYKNDAFAAHPGVAARSCGCSRCGSIRRGRGIPQGSRPSGRTSARTSTPCGPSNRIGSCATRSASIDATVRTNAFVPERRAIAFKLRSAAVPEMPKPTPLFEIFVYSPDMEAVHLRGGRVARGGIRWSDRRQDYRTEVLGLLKAQMVKNAVIVPTGAKGGFVLKHPVTDPRRSGTRARGST